MSAAALSTSYFQPYDSNGAPVEPIGGNAAFGENNRGVFLLAAGTYYYNIGHADASVLHAQIQGDDVIAITSATIEECSLAPTEAPLHSDVTGQWFATDINRITSVAEGAGWTNTSDVGANSAGNAGGVSWHITAHGARRTRIKLVVGTEGSARVAGWGRE